MTAPSSTEEGKASRGLVQASLLSVVGSLLALAVPAGLLLLSQHHLYGLSPSSPSLVEGEALLVVVGAVLIVVALFLYRRAFGHLKHADPRLRPASLLCLVGSVGALAVVVAGALVSGGTSAVKDCAGGQATHALTCLRAADPTAGYLVLVGFWLAWIGVVGLAAGLILSGRHFRKSSIAAGGAVFGIVAVDLLVPFADSLVHVPGSAYALALAPFAAVLGGILVYAGAASERPAAGQVPTG